MKNTEKSPYRDGGQVIIQDDISSLETFNIEVKGSVIKTNWYSRLINWIKKLLFYEV